jgi:anti-sigma regulatory factor (Ser/Thr protein kinase)
MAIMTREPSAPCRLGRDPAEVGRARELARKALSGWGLVEHAGLAELIVSELATNALRHGEGPIEVGLSYDSGDLRAEVHDEGAGRPVRQQATANDEQGRGLELLDGLSELYGGTRGVVDDSDGPGKTVYVAVSLATTSDECSMSISSDQRPQ